MLGRPGTYPGSTASLTVALESCWEGIGSHWNCTNPVVSVTSVFDVAGVASGSTQRNWPLVVVGVAVSDHPALGW